MNETPSQQAKSAGLKSLAELSRITGESQRNLINWHKSKPKRFAIMCEWASNQQEIEMEITNLGGTYMLRTGEYHSSFFETFKVYDSGVELYIKRRLVTVLHFEQANEFYKAWRAYQCSI